MSRFNISLIFILSLVFVVSSAHAAVDWSQFTVFSSSAQPYAMNGPGCFSPTFTSNYASAKMPGDDCPGSTAAEKSSYDIGAVWVDMNDGHIGWQIMGPSVFGVNGSNPVFCNVSSPYTAQSLVVEFDADNNQSSGCIGNRPCYTGADYQIIFASGGNKTFRYYNSSLPTCQCSVNNPQNDNGFGDCHNCFQINASVSVETTNPRCDNQYGFRFAINKSVISHLAGINFVVNVLQIPPTSGDPVKESLGSGGASKIVMSGQQDMMFMQGGMCAKYDRTNSSACQNNADNFSCIWDSAMRLCNANFSAMTCSQMCGRCGNASACSTGAKGKCMVVQAPPMPPPDALIFSNSMCIEDMTKFQFGGTGGSCDSDCKFCVSESMCNSSAVSNPQSGGNGCKWVTDPVFQKSWCDSVTFDANKFTCSNTSLDRCMNSSACNAVAYNATVNATWNATLGVCTFPGREVCFDGVDNNGNGLVDCADSDCSKDAFCGGELLLLTDPTLMQKGGANLNLLDAMKFKMFEGADPSPPAILGGKAANASVTDLSLRITGLAIKDMGTSLGIGVKVVDLSGTKLCSGPNATSVYYYMLDTDNNQNSGCTANISGTNYTGFEYKLEYAILQNSTGNLSEVKKAYRCLSGNFVLYPAKMAGSPVDLSFGGGNVPLACIGNTAIVAIDKVDLGNPTQTIRIRAAASDNATSLAAANDTLLCPGNNGVPCDGFFYSPNAFDFKPMDCFANPMACGSAFSIIGGGKFMPFEDCMAPGDEDMDNLTNCADSDCIMAPFCAGQAGQYNISADKTAPTVFGASAETFTDFVMLHWTTNEPTNATITLHNTCQNGTDAFTLYDVGDPNFAMDDYRPWHAQPLDNYMNDSTNPSNHAGLIQNGTYFYKLKVCDMAGNCAVSGCLNFTMKATGANMSFQYKFDFVPPANSFVNTTMIKIWNGSAYTNITQGQIQNQATYLKNATLKFDNPDNSWSIEIPGIDIAKAATLNMSSAFNVTNNTPGGKMFIGMDNNKWLEIAQNLGGDSIKITIPEGGDRLIKCQSDNTSNCQDVTGNATLVAGGSGYNYTTWDIPTSLGFSVYGVNQSGSVLNSDKDVYKCYPNCTMYFNLTTSNASLIGIRNITITYSDDSGGKMSYATYVYNGSWPGAPANVDANTTANLTDYNLTAVDPQLRVMVNMSAPGAAHLNVTLNIQNATGSQVNITDSAFVDAINLTSPANAAVVSSTNNYSFVLYSLNDTNQTCNLYVNGTPSGMGIGLNGTQVSVASNFTYEGTYPWYVSCGDTPTAIGVSAIRYVKIDASAPTVTLNSPANMTSMTNASAINFNWTANDTMSAGLTCNLSINGVVNYTVTAAANSTLNDSVSLVDGTYIWSVVCNDSTGHVGNSVNRTLVVDSVAPLITLNSPIAGANATNNTLTVNVTLNGTRTQIAYATFAFVGSTSSTYVYNISNSSTSNASCLNTTQGSELFYCTFTTSSLGDGNYTLNVGAWDSAGNSNNSAINFTMMSPPTVTINTPTILYWYKANFVFNVTATDDNLTSVQYRILDANATNITAWATMINSSAPIYNTTITSSSITNDGNYTMVVNATDGMGRNTTKNVTFFMDRTVPVISSLSLSSLSVSVGATITKTCSASDNSESFGGTLTTTYSPDIDTSSAGSGKTVTCIVTDRANNNATLSNTYTVTTTVAGSGGGGGTPATTQDVHTFAGVGAGGTMTAPISVANLAVSEVAITVQNAASNVQLTVQAVTTPTAGTPAVTASGGGSGSVYSYLQITTTNLASTNIQTAKVKFTVPKSWLTSHSVTTSSVSLQRLVGTTWNQLTTRVLSETSTNVNYEADTPGFSLFAIFASTSSVANVTANATVAAQNCTVGTKRCSGNYIQVCSSNGTMWSYNATCENGCNVTSLACNAAVVTGGQNQTGNETLGQGPSGTAPSGGFPTEAAAFAVVIVLAAAGFLFWKFRMSHKYKFKSRA